MEEKKSALKTFGIRTDNVKKSLLPYVGLFFTLAFFELLFVRENPLLPKTHRALSSPVCFVIACYSTQYSSGNRISRMVNAGITKKV